MTRRGLWKSIADTEESMGRAAAAVRKAFEPFEATSANVADHLARENEAIGWPQEAGAAERSRRSIAPGPSANGGPAQMPTQPTRRSLLDRRVEALRSFLVRRAIPQEDWCHLRRHALSRKALHDALCDAAPDLFAKLTTGGFRTAFLQKQTLVRIAEGDE